MHSRTTICPLGYKCPQNDATATACDPTAGEYQDQKGATVCLTCPTGYYCDQTSATRCEPQNSGDSFYCKATGSEPRSVACDEGTYSYQDRASSQADCLECPKGYYCPINPTSNLEKILQCPESYYCMGGVSDSAGSGLGYFSFICPEGFYCPVGTNVPKPCDVGSYCEGTGNVEPTAPCKEGYYCELLRTGFPSLVGGIEFCMNEDSSLCYYGHSAESDASYICPAGYYCPLGTFKPKPCAIGTWSNT